MDDVDYKSILDEFYNKYASEFSPNYEFNGFEKFESKTLLGICRYNPVRNPETNNYIVICKISISNKLKNHPLLARAVLWHEFAHYWHYQVYGTGGHGREWKKFYYREKGLVVIDWLSKLIL